MLNAISPFVCVECHRADRQGDGRGWKADLAGGHDDQQLELAVLCPECSAREIADDARRSRS